MFLELLFLIVEKCRQTLAYLGYDYLSPAVANKPSPLAINKVSVLIYV